MQKCNVKISVLGQEILEESISSIVRLIRKTLGLEFRNQAR